MAQFADLVAAQPDVIVLMPCGFNIEQTQTAILELLAQPAWQEFLSSQQPQSMRLMATNTLIGRGSV